MTSADPARFLGHHYLYRTHRALAGDDHRVIEAEIEIGRRLFLHRHHACRWRTLNLHPPLVANGHARLSRGLCTITLHVNEGLAELSFLYVAEDDGSDILGDVKLGIVAGRSSTTLSPYCSAVLFSRRKLETADVVALLGNDSTTYIRIAETKGKLAQLAAKLASQ